MDKKQIKSQAFHGAALNSESYRLLGLLALLAVLMLFVIARGVATRDYLLLIAQALVLAIAIGFEVFMLRTVKEALRDDSDVPSVMWVMNVFVESQIPTVALFLLLAGNWLPPHQVLVAPVVLLYFLLIVLSALRLSPGLAILTGLLSALGYLFTAFYIEFRFRNPDVTLAVPARGFYFIYAVGIFAGGIVAAIVAGQIRSHVTAALREAALQSELDQVNHDLDIARSIQQGLIPTKAPSLDDFEIGGWNKPADQTGGDYFDWQTLPDGRVAVSLGDATGHGIGPALVSSSCRAYARASFAAGDDRNGLLERLNGLLADDLSSNRFVTFAVVFLDPANSSVKVLSAGHGPILWYKYATDEIANLDAQGIPLGMIASVKYSKANEMNLAPGDMVALVTDGFYEWEDPAGEEFGLKRLDAVIRESRDCHPDEVISRLRSAVESFCKGTEQKDDMTAVILKRKN